MSDYWCGHKVYDPSDLERRFAVEDGLGYLTVTTTEHLPPERENQLTRVRGVLDRIPPREADFVELYFFRRLRQTAIADIFNVSQPTVCYRLQRAAARRPATGRPPAGSPPHRTQHGAQPPSALFR